MSFWDSLRGWLGIPIGAQDGDNFRTGMITTEAHSDAGAGGTGAAIGLSATWACVGLISGTIASLPLMVYRTTDGVRQVASNHPLYAILHETPNEEQTAYDFWEFQQAGIELYGNGFAEIKRSADGSRVVALEAIKPNEMAVRRGRTGQLEYEWMTRGTRTIASANEVLHLRGFGGDPLGGVSTLRACAGAFGGAVATDRTARSMFAKGMYPSGMLSTDKPLTGEQRAKLEQLLQERFIGAVNAGRPLLLDNGLTWNALTISPEDAQMLETRRFGVEEICRIFGVPPHMIGHSEKSTSWGTGLEQQTLGFVKFSLTKRLERIEQRLMKQLLSFRDRAEGITIEFNVEGLLRGDSAARAGFYHRMWAMGAMTTNEIRRLENMPPVPGGDEPRAQMQNVPLREAANG